MAGAARNLLDFALREAVMRMFGDGLPAGVRRSGRNLAGAFPRWRRPTRLHGPEGQFAASRGTIIEKSPRHIPATERRTRLALARPRLCRARLGGARFRFPRNCPKINQKKLGTLEKCFHAFAQYIVILNYLFT
jgi:hypothetical protein